MTTDQGVFPSISVSITNARFDTATVESYKALTETPSAVEDGVPMLYPHSFLGPIHLQLMTHDAFPFGLLGALHAR
jgi:hypothetical protein